MGVAKDQNGCRFLQRKFEEGGAAAIAAVFPEILDNLIELMIDPFGNYLIQKLLDRCSEEQRLQVKAAGAPVSVGYVQSGHCWACKTGVLPWAVLDALQGMGAASGRSSPRICLCTTPAAVQSVLYFQPVRAKGIVHSFVPLQSGWWCCLAHARPLTTFTLHRACSQVSWETAKQD